VGSSRGRKGKIFFFEKKKQKTFGPLSRTKWKKVFWFFFQKRTAFLLLVPHRAVVATIVINATHVASGHQAASCYFLVTMVVSAGR
jgi:hypothetical protein